MVPCRYRGKENYATIDRMVEIKMQQDQLQRTPTWYRCVAATAKLASYNASVTFSKKKNVTHHNKAPKKCLPCKVPLDHVI